MKALSRIVDVILYIVVFITVASAIGGTITKKPFLMTAVRSNSMYPLFQRGDMLLISPVLSKTNLNVGDIIIFDPEEGSLASKGIIAHRIYSGNEAEGFITKGDANEEIDQIYKNDSSIKKEWITNLVITIGKQPVKIPLLGYITLWMDKYQKSPYLLPAISLILAVIVGIGETTNNKKKRIKKNKLEMPLIYFFCGLTISIMIGTSMLAMGQHLKLAYEVSETNQGVIMGSDVGVMTVGENIERPLSELNNKGFFPMTCTSTTDDSQITFSHNILSLGAGQSLETNYKVEAKTPGKYESIMHVGMFLPILPKNIIYFLAKQSYWLALIVISLIPGLPIMLYPLIDSRMRRKTIKEFRHKVRRIKGLISFNS
jgi:signal peptidase I